MRHVTAKKLNLTAIPPYNVQNGINSERIITLELFDYLSNNSSENNYKFNKNIVYAGNPKKSPFIYQLDENKIKYNINIYGKGLDSDINKRIKYKGSFHPNDLPKDWKGSVGLVWDGNYDELDQDE